MIEKRKIDVDFESKKKFVFLYRLTIDTYTCLGWISLLLLMLKYFRALCFYCETLYRIEFLGNNLVASNIVELDY